MLFFLFLFLSIEHKAFWGVGVEEKIGERIPSNILFYTKEYPQGVTLSFFLKEKKPIVLVPIYYRCPGICSFLLKRVQDAMLKITSSFLPARDYLVIVFSFNHKEKVDLAEKKKQSYLEGIPLKYRPYFEKGWFFSVLNKEDIKRLTSSMGFSFRKEGEEFLHTAVVIFLSSEGKIVRYLYSSLFSAEDFRLALKEAKGEKSLFLRYDSKEKRYRLRREFLIFLALFLSTLGGGGIFLLFYLRAGKKRA